MTTCWPRRKTAASATWASPPTATTDVMKRFLEAYGKDMEFCQIQLNYLDWDFQDAKRKVELLNQWKHPRVGDGAPAGRQAGFPWPRRTRPS